MRAEWALQQWRSDGWHTIEWFVGRSDAEKFTIGKKGYRVVHRTEI